MTGYLTTGNASIIYQTIANIQYYLTNLYANQIYQTIFGMYLYQKVSNMVNYQPKSSYQLTQDMNYCLSIRSAILNFQPKISYQLTQDMIFFYLIVVQY